MVSSSRGPPWILFLGIMMELCPVAGYSWGDEGHEIVARIAEQFLTPRARARVASILSSDATGLTRTDMAAEATWADKYRDSDRNASQARYRATQAWHYVDLELDQPGTPAVCLRHRSLPGGTPASQGPADDCIIDKISQFRHEIGSPATPPQERRVALQFLLHFVGDIHQPLHAADHHDHGGNDVLVKTADARTGSLHHYWDTVFVGRLGAGSGEVAARLSAAISASERRAWSSGSPAEWARQSNSIARIYAYTYPAQPADVSRRMDRAILLDDRYRIEAEAAVRLQLERAGVRLARLLNAALR